MHQTIRILMAFLATFLTSSGLAQATVWDGLARTTFDTAAGTLRVPCAVLEDGTGAALPDFAPAFALNLQLVGDVLRLVEPLQALDEIPEICLDTLVIDGNIATYSTESAELDSSSVENTNLFYTMELQATIPAEGSIDFTVLSAEDRLYIRPFFDGETFIASAGLGFYTKDFIYDDSLVVEARRLMLLDIVVGQPGNLQIECDFFDPQALLEVVGNVGGVTQYRMKPSVTSADNGKLFSITCIAFDYDINRLELTIPMIEWVVNLP